MYAMAYAEARLKAQDEERAARLAADPRVYRRDEDEGGPTPCVICERPVETGRSGQGLVCRSCRAEGWTAKQCECGAPITLTDSTGPTSPHLINRCKRCREEMAPPPDGCTVQTIRQRRYRAQKRAKGEA